MTDDESKPSTLGEIWEHFSRATSSKDGYQLEFREQFLSELGRDFGSSVDNFGVIEWRAIAIAVIDQLSALTIKLAEHEIDKDELADISRDLFNEVKRRRIQDKKRVAKRSDQIDKRAFQDALLTNIDAYGNIGEAIRDLRVKPQFQSRADETLRKWATEVWTKPKKRGRPKEK